MNKTITAVLSTLAIGSAIIAPMSINAVENNVVDTFSWTAGYYEGNAETPIYGVDCTANVYKDGTVKIDFSTDKITSNYTSLSSSIPYDISSKEYYYMNGKDFPSGNFIFRSNSRDVWNTVDLSYYDGSIYNTPELSNTGFVNSYSPYSYSEYIIDTVSGSTGAARIGTINTWSSKGNMNVRSGSITFTPKTTITQPTKIHILNRDITVMGKSSESTSDDIIELQKRITELENENAKLKADYSNATNELNKIKAYNFDVDFNGQVDACDASLVLSAYAHNSTIYGNNQPVYCMDDFNKYMSK